MRSRLLYAQSHQGAGNAKVPGPQGLGVPRPLSLWVPRRKCVRGLRQGGESLGYLPAQELLSYALELRNFKLLGI